MAKQDASTKTKILDTALALSRKLGFESLSIGMLAKEVGMSKSGLFSHFESKEHLQIQILEHAAATFTAEVLVPAIQQNPRGLGRLEAFFNGWLQWVSSTKQGGCPFIHASIEFGDRPGPVRDCMVYQLDSLVKSIAKAITLAIETGDIKNTQNPEQLAFEIYSYILGYHSFKHTLNHEQAKAFVTQSFDQFITRNRA